MMMQLRPRPRLDIHASALLFALAGGLGGCERTARPVAADTLLTRDLTLAASATSTVPPITLGDTARSTPSAAQPNKAANASRATTVATKSPTSASKERAKSPPTSREPEAAPTASPATAATVPVVAPTTSAPSAPVGSSSTGGGAAVGTTAGHRLGTGTALVGRTGSEICSLANRPGDRLVASLGSEVTSSDGARLPAGTPILVEMSTPQAGHDFSFIVKAVQVSGVLVPVDGSVQVAGATTERRISKGGEKEKVIGGAIAGAILGRVLGGGAKGTVIGAAGGAAAGTVAAARSGVTEKCLPAGATLTVTLSAPLVLPPGAP